MSRACARLPAFQSFISYGDHQHWSMLQHGNLGQCSLSLCLWLPWAAFSGRLNANFMCRSLTRDLKVYIILYYYYLAQGRLVLWLVKSLCTFKTGLSMSGCLPAHLSLAAVSGRHGWDKRPLRRAEHHLSTLLQIQYLFLNDVHDNIQPLNRWTPFLWHCYNFGYLRGNLNRCFL